MYIVLVTSTTPTVFICLGFTYDAAGTAHCLPSNDTMIHERCIVMNLDISGRCISLVTSRNLP
jgi:hypothetical protein